MMEWAYQFDNRNPMFGGGSVVGVYSISEPSSMPTFGFKLTTMGNWTFHAVASEDGRLEPAKLAQIDVGGKWATGFENSGWTTKQKKASRGIGIIGFGKTVELKKVCDDSAANSSNNVLLQGMDFSAAPPEEVRQSGKPIMRFTTKDCRWLSLADGTLVAELVLSLPPGMTTNTTPMEEINIDPMQFLEWMQKPVGLRLSRSLSPEDSQLLMAAVAPCAPFLLRGCELTLDSETQRNNM